MTCPAVCEQHGALLRHSVGWYGEKWECPRCLVEGVTPNGGAAYSNWRRASSRHDLGWHVICGTHLLETLRRATAGEDADLLFAELWANAEHEEAP